MEYKLYEKKLRGVLSSLRMFELQVSFLQRMTEDLKFEILGILKEQEEKENGTL